MKIVENITSNGKLNGGAFWEFKKKFSRKVEQPHAMINAEGKKVFAHDEIKKVYKDFYEKLLNNKEQHEQSESNNIVSAKFEDIMKSAEEQQPLVVSRSTVATVFKKLKRKKARDDKGWNNELMKDGGEEMEKSAEMMINCVLSEEIIPDEWNSMLIKSNHKKGEKMHMKNKRGIFLTNVVSKAFEKAVEIEMGPVEFDIFQAGGTKDRSTSDNWIIVMAMRDRFRYLREDLYLFFGDLVKCFDKLWLKDCLIDLHTAGAREKEIKILYLLNQKSTAKIITPAGTTDEITILETVKQGTVFAPKLCCASTGNLNNMSKPIRTTITPRVTVGALTFVDDMIGGGKKTTIENVMSNCAEIEVLKNWEFSTDKSNWMLLKFGKKNEDDEDVVKGTVKGGDIEKTDIYKMLGNWINDKGNMDKQLDRRYGKENTNVCKGV